MSSDDREQYYSTNASHDETADNGEKGTLLPPRHPQSPPSKTNSSDDSRRWWKDRKYVLELCGFLVLSAYTIFSGLQWAQIRWTNRLTREALDKANQASSTSSVQFQTQLQHFDAGIGRTELLAKHAGEQAKNSATFANAAKEQAGISERSLQSTIENFHEDQRAWIGVDSWALTSFIVGQPTEMKVRVMNRGRTPAIEVKGGGTGWRIVPNDDTPSQVEAVIQEEFGKITLSARAPISPQNGEEFIGTEDAPLDVGRYNAIIDGLSTAYMTGKVTFKYVFRRQQWMTYCLQMKAINKQLQIAYCDTGNDMSYQH